MNGSASFVARRHKLRERSRLRTGKWNTQPKQRIRSLRHRDHPNAERDDWTYGDMGDRVYLSKVGRFLQVDRVDGGSANAYDHANQDPVNLSDLSGNRFSIGGVAQVVAGELSIALGVTIEVTCSAGTVAIGDVLGPFHCYTAAGVPIAGGGEKFRIKLRVVRRINRLQCSTDDYINVTARAAPKR